MELFEDNTLGSFGYAALRPEETDVPAEAKRISEAEVEAYLDRFDALERDIEADITLFPVSGEEVHSLEIDLDDENIPAAHDGVYWSIKNAMLLRHAIPIDEYSEPERNIHWYEDDAATYRIVQIPYVSGTEDVLARVTYLKIDDGVFAVELMTRAYAESHTQSKEVKNPLVGTGMAMIRRRAAHGLYKQQFGDLWQDVHERKVEQYARLVRYRLARDCVDESDAEVFLAGERDERIRMLTAFWNRYAMIRGLQALGLQTAKLFACAAAGYLVEPTRVPGTEFSGGFLAGTALGVISLLASMEQFGEQELRIPNFEGLPDDGSLEKQLLQEQEQSKRVYEALQRMQIWF